MLHQLPPTRCLADPAAHARIEALLVELVAATKETLVELKNLPNSPAMIARLRREH